MDLGERGDEQRAGRKGERGDWTEDVLEKNKEKEKNKVE